MNERARQQRVAITFDCGPDTMVGVLNPGDPGATRGAVIVVGGPQYRVGSHRQFTLLARDLAASGVPVMRFDHRGIGDSAGEPAGFEALDDDIRRAVDVFFEQVPGLAEVVIVGLCDAASAAMMYVPGDSRISGLVLLNPWARSEAGLARSTIRQYYTRQLTSGAFWGRLVRGDVSIVPAMRSLARTLRRALGLGAESGPGNAERGTGAQETAVPFQERMRDGFAGFTGQVLFVLSGDDLTATEFVGLTGSSRIWKRAMGRSTVTVKRLPDANHTFSRRVWRDQVAAWTAEWFGSW